MCGDGVGDGVGGVLLLLVVVVGVVVFFLEGRVGMAGLRGVEGGVAFGFGGCVGCCDSSVVVVVVFRSVVPNLGDTASSSPM